MAEKTAKPKQDMGTGSVKKLMVQMAVPALVGQVVNLLYNIVDRIYIGHIPEIGGTALTGVGLFSPILMLITAFAMMAGSGGAPRAAIAMGQGDKEKAEKILGNCFTVLMIFAVLLTIVFYIACPTLLRWFGASDATLPYAVEYGRIYILGSVFVLTVMGMNTFITTQGFAKISMLTTVIGAVINIVLDPILMFGLGLGVKGAAIATVLSQAVSAVWILKFLTGKQTILKLKPANMKLIPSIILPCLGLGVSTFVMLSTESILSISFTSSLARYGGDVAVGAMTVLTSINQLLTMPLSGVCQGGQPLISFNYGAKKYDRVKEAFFCQFFTCVAYTTVFWLLLQLMPNFFAGIFTSDAALVDYTAWALKIFLACGFSVGFQISCQQAFMALGQAKISLVMALLRKVILLIPMIFLLPNFFADKAFAVFLAEPVSDVIAAAVTTFMFFRFFLKMLKDGKAAQRANLK
ncbi:MAG: MATE family efflux transporter [Oscillospiraceae bacterium]|nr:MATE family efflux transporter [Oscillospiraceae bacterium]